MANFLLEVGTEELPARFLHGLEKELKECFSSSLNVLGFQSVEVFLYVTPRRLVIYLKGLDTIQPFHEEEVVGPPINIAFDSTGSPTKAAIGFAKTLGVTLDDLKHVVTDKGTYLSGIKKTGGMCTSIVLSSVCPEIFTKLSAPKRMRWGSGSFAFIRPIRWILALLDTDIVSFTLGNVCSNRYTFGHRCYCSEKIEVPCADEYFTIIQEKGKVILDAKVRRDRILNDGNKTVVSIDGRVLWVDTLLEEVVGLVEHPYPMLGSIDPKFLELPKEVLLTSMESHQKSFGVLGNNGNLLPYFLTVLNMDPPDVALVKQGWERVLQARLEDASFFWKVDLESSFEEWCTKLEHIIFLEPLGNMAQKTHRISALCGCLSKKVEGVSYEDAREVGLLSKADLVSSMVEEFPELQGIMGGIYATYHGKSAYVARALSEQYLPSGPDTVVPSTDLGSLLSIADKLDTLIGCFGLGIIPTGTADPYALRRCALGIIRIILEKGYSFSLQELFIEAQKGYGDIPWKLSISDVIQKLEEFFRARLKNYFLTLGYETIIIDAVITAQSDPMWTITQRLDCLTQLSRHKDFYQKIHTFKRVINIVKKYSEDSGSELTGAWNQLLLHEDAEKTFSDQLTSAFTLFGTYRQQQNIEKIFEIIIELQPNIDIFFDNIMIMCDKSEIRVNRLNMLKALTQYMGELVDFSALQV